MLFNSIEFIAVFLPVAVAGFFLLAARRANWLPMAWLVLASLVFYSWWDYRNLFVIVPSIVGNYLLGWAIGVASAAGHPGRARFLTAAGVAANLAAIGYFKYFNFAATALAGATGLDIATHAILLPLGISFFTFQQIKFLVDRHAGVAPQPDPLGYALLVSFFPHVIAGPIVNYDDLLPQFRKPSFLRFAPDLFADGVALFLLGLAKKVVLADQFGSYAYEGFSAVAQGHSVTLFAAWGAALAYTLQLYFDFSGYSDMAIGLARMFGLHFPLNFNSPYKAQNIIEFWRRWHMTLSRFLRDYLYIPLGGNRHGPVRRHVNLLLTMLLGGLWHGAAWTFVFWGGLHGVYLVVNHAWHGLRRMVGWPAGKPSWGGLWLGRGVTLLAVIVGWVFFRADSFAAAAEMLRGMAGRNGAVLPSQLIDVVPLLGRLASGLPSVPFSGNGTVLGFVEMVILLAFGLAITLLAPNLYDISARTRVALLIPSFAFTLQKVVFSAGASQFLYFRF
jgi:alginate O-acetyltransferase complex protein AlgI